MCPRPVSLLLVLLGLATGAAGCGLGQGPDAGSTSLRVTRDFGAARMLDTDRPKTAGQDTVLRLLQRNAKVTTKYGGGFVQSIDGRSGGRTDGRPHDWFFYVNGILAPQGAGAVRVKDGDRIWWDEHDWSQVQDIPAVVGSFPAPFTGGLEDKRLPIRVECTVPGADYCRAARKRFGDIGLTAAQGGLQGSQLAETTRVLVGTYDQLGVDDTAALLQAGPEGSGVYALLAADGRSLQTLDAAGDPVRTLGPGTGLVAALKLPGSTQIAWVITGTDQAGLDSAIRAVGERTLAGKFAVAVRGDDVIGLPEPTPARGAR